MFKQILKILMIGPIVSTFGNGLDHSQTRSFLPKESMKKLTAFADKSTTAGRAKYIKDLYYSVNGYPAGYDTSNSPDPYLNLFNSILGEKGIGGILYSSGYKSCDAIPDSGTASGAVDRIGTLNLTFGTSSKTVPSYYPADGGKAMDKKITVSGSVDVSIELKCNVDTTIQTGYVKLTFSQYNIVYEGYFQQNSTTNAVNVDLYVKTQTGGGTNLLIPTQFSTADGDNYSIYSAYIDLSGSGGNGNYLVAVNGATNGKAQIAYMNTTDSSGTATTTAPNNFGGLSSSGGTSVAVECIDIPTETLTTGCSNIPAPGSLSIGGTTSIWTVSSLKNVSL